MNILLDYEDKKRIIRLFRERFDNAEEIEYMVRFLEDEISFK